MSEIQPYNGTQNSLMRDVRRASRAISRYQTGGQLRIAQVDTETDVALVKVDALTTATGNAMGAVVRVAQAQQQLGLLAPAAAGRLAYLADSHMLAMGDLMQDLRRDLRRK